MTNTTSRTRLRIILPALILIPLSGCRSKSTEGDVPYRRTQNYKYSELIVKDYDEMQGMVQTLVRKSQTAGGEDPAVEYLQSALKLIFSRPDSDNMVAKLTTEVRRELTGYSQYEKVIAQLAAEAVDNLKNEGNTVSVRTTSSFILENLLAEIRPEAEREANDLRKTVQRIADSRIELDRGVRSERKLRGMYRSPNPGDEAEKIIEGITAREKADKKQREEDAKRAKEEAKRAKKEVIKPAKKPVEKKK